MFTMSIILFLLVTLTVGSCATFRLVVGASLLRSVAVMAGTVSLVAFAVLKQYEAHGFALLALAVGYLVMCYAIYRYFHDGELFDIPLLWPWRTPVTLMPAPEGRPSMYVRVQALTPEQLRRARRIVRNKRLQDQVEALLILHKKREFIKAVA